MNLILAHEWHIRVLLAKMLKENEGVILITN